MIGTSLPLSLDCTSPFLSELGGGEELDYRNDGGRRAASDNEHDLPAHLHRLRPICAGAAHPLAVAGERGAGAAGGAQGQGDADHEDFLNLPVEPRQPFEAATAGIPARPQGVRPDGPRRPHQGQE